VTEITPRQADIIAFPTRPAVDAAQLRLKVALADLLAALEQQRSAVAAWRGALGNLKIAVHQLGASVGDYRANLTALAAGVQDLNRTARTLADS